MIDGSNSATATADATAIVLGSTGLVGRALVDGLTRAPHVDRVVSVTRRPVAYASPKVVNEVVDFERLDALGSIFRGEWLFSALGTTRDQAGSIEAQRRVDVDYQYEAARLAAAGGVRHLLLVSSAGADAGSRNPYLRMKGELETRVLALGFPRVSIVQPSLLVGPRERPRLGERVAAPLLRALALVPGVGRYRPIRGEQVAARMIERSAAAGPPVEWFRLDEVFLPRERGA